MECFNCLSVRVVAEQMVTDDIGVSRRILEQRANEWLVPTHPVRIESVQMVDGEQQSSDEIITGGSEPRSQPDELLARPHDSRKVSFRAG